MPSAGLLLGSGGVYGAFGPPCHKGQERGCGAGGTTAGEQTAMWSSEVTWAGGGGGIWQSGGGIVQDSSGFLYVATGNGVSPSAAPGNQPPPYLSESVAKLKVNADGSLSTADVFSPCNDHD